MDPNDVKQILARLDQIEEMLRTLKSKIDWIDTNVSSIKMTVDSQ